MPMLQPFFKLPLKFILGSLLISAVIARPGTNDNYGQQFKTQSGGGGFGMGTEGDDRYSDSRHGMTLRSHGRSSIHYPLTTPAYSSNRGFDYGSGSTGSHKIGTGASGSHAIGSGAVPSFTDSVLTKSTEITGILMCGEEPARDVVVRLYRNTTEIIENLLTVVKTKDDGSFRIEGNTAGKGADETGIVPRIRFFHKCDDSEKEKGHRTFGFTVEDPMYVTLGRISRKPFDIGKLNIQMIYPGEKREMKFTNDMPLGAPI